MLNIEDNKMQSAESIYIFSMSSENQKAAVYSHRLTDSTKKEKKKKDLIKNPGNAQKHPGSIKSCDPALVFCRHRKWVSLGAYEWG